MAYDPKNLSLLVQGQIRIWVHKSADGPDKDADGYFDDPRLRRGDLIIDMVAPNPNDEWQITNLQLVWVQATSPSPMIVYQLDQASDNLT